MPENEILEKLNPEQKEAVTHKEGPLLIVAGAGTGKTTVITKRIAWLILEKITKPEEILALTFTEKAAAEMEERVDKILPYGYVDLWISTFHSFCERILKAHAIDIGLPNNFELLNETQQWLLVRKNLDKFNLDYYRPLGNPTKFIHTLIKHFSRCKDEVIFPQDYLEYAEELKLNSDSPDFIKKIIPDSKNKKLSKNEIKEITSQEIMRINEIANAYHIYQQLLLDNQALDFGDLINYCIKLFKERPKILEQYRSQFKYIMLDEFQDTNYAQYELIKILAAPKNNLTVVGDDDQSIYAFRGSSMSNILQFRDDYKNCKEILLTKNYRSCQEILNLSYNFIKQNNPDRLEVRLEKSKKLSSQIQGKGHIEHIHQNTLEDEIESVIKKIVEIKKEDEEATWNDFAILVRANDSAKAFTNFLSKTDIPYQFLSLKGLYYKPIIIDILSYFKLLDNYHEASAMYRVLSMPFLDINHEDISTLMYLASRKGTSLYSICNEINYHKNISQNTKNKITKIITLIKNHSHLAKEQHLEEIFLAFLNDSGYLKYLNSLEDIQSNEKLSHLQQFYKRIQKFGNSYNQPRLKEFMEEIEYELEAGEQGSLAIDPTAGPELLKIMTTHSAKGLEFKYVFIVNLVDRKFPTIERKDPIQLPEKLIKEILPQGDAHLQEERRLFYVAITRGKNSVFFSSSSDYGGLRKKKLSRFLTELSEVGLDLSNETEEAQKDISLEKTPEPKKTKVTQKKYTLPKKFSFTQIKAFESCPYQYKLAHIVKIPTQGKPTFSYGKTLHSTLQEYFKQYLALKNNNQASLFEENTGKDTKLPTLEKLLTIYEEKWIDQWYPNQKIKEEYKKQGSEALKEFYKKINENPPKPRLLESGFNLKIGDYSLRGVIDRVDDGDQSAKIIDYKTGNTPRDEKKVDKDQLIIYQLAMEEVFKEKVESLSYYYLDGNKEISFLGKEAEKEKLKEKIISTVEKINSSNFTATPGWQCQFCDFANICEYKK